MDQDALEDLEIQLLLQGVSQVYGYDFLNYAPASLKRRLHQWLTTSSYTSFSQAQASVLRDRHVFDSLLRGITVNVTEMFRDPHFFQAIRDKVVPFLQTYPSVKIWHAGCATGEEAFSMAIVLKEAGLAGRYRMYATDINEAVLEKAKEGIFPLQSLQDYTRNYQKSGGLAAFSDYYTARYDNAIFNADLKDDIVFSPHNLVADGAFGEMNLILCRNVMIYFKPVLKERCMALFDRSLAPGGFLCLGTKETMDGKLLAPRYEALAPHLSVYKKRYG
jgi:chemotaxis protein methyltransferase CheR